MRCKQCNAILDDNARFCRFCGAKVEGEAAPAPIPTPVESESSVSEEPITMPEIEVSSGTSATSASKKSNGPSKVLIGGVIAVALIIVLLLLFRTPLFGNHGTIDTAYEISLTESEDTNYDEWADSNYEAATEEETEETDIDMPDIDDSFFESERNEEPAPEEPEPEEPAHEEEPEAEEAEETEEEESNEDRDTNDRLVIATGGLRLRDQPNLSGKKLALIPDGTIITVEGEYDGWAYTRYEGKYGWCSSEFLFYPSRYSLVTLYSARVTSQSGIELITDKYIGSRKAKTTIPYEETVRVYEIDGKNAFVSYRGIYGWCSTEYLRRR
ncbi:MAG: SH3 domain-containing protein [Clostridia bacterium]|nr:SH3 domain-containing protein [Clostridia bacterium]